MANQLVGTMGEGQEDKKTDLLSIPREVIDAGVLPHLKWNDLLRFRRVCKETNVTVHGYMSVHPELAPEIEINEEDRNFGAFLKMNIPASRIFLNNLSGDDFYEEAGKNSVRFLERFGHHVMHLRVVQFSFFIYGKEWDFLDALVNLESFEAGYFGYGRRVDQREAEAVVDRKQRRQSEDPRCVKKEGDYLLLPNTLKKVKSMIVRNSNEFQFETVNGFTFLYMLTNKAVEHVALPFHVNMPVSEMGDGQFEGRSKAFMFAHLLNLFTRDPNDDTPLPAMNFKVKVIDFGAYHDGEETPTQAKTALDCLCSAHFLRLCVIGIKYNVKFMNVGHNWLQAWNKLPEFRSPELGETVLSLVNINPCVFPLPMPNLERIEIRTTLQSSVKGNWREQRPDWPSLRTLDITVDSSRAKCYAFNEGARELAGQPTNTKDLFMFFFKDIVRTSLTELRLNFMKRSRDGSTLPIPRMEDVVSACPNLKKLTIVNWLGTNKALTKLWSGLPGLEEISLEYCKDLGNVAFIGEDSRSPVFFKLAKLKKLTLKGLDQMTKISDTLFKLVIRHLKLTHLTLTSDAPLKSVTLAGIQSLLEGSFADSIQRFPFGEWSLENVSPKKLEKLEKEFRSFSMI